MTSHRLASGGLVDRRSTLRFSFDGRDLTGHAGDTLASALLANGRRLVGRSFKYHRPRGIMTAGVAEPNALVTIGRDGRTEPNVRATTQELYDGLQARSQNRWPSLAFDIGAINGLLAPFLGAGFYYKTFMWPAALWERLYEPIIRNAAGLGRATYLPDPDHYEKCWAHCDLLVIGGGAAGLAAALTAGRAGARVILVDEQAQVGGGLLSDTATIGGASAADSARQIAAELDEMPNVDMLVRTTCFGWYDSNVFGAVERVQKHVDAVRAGTPVERLWRIVAKRALLASGTQERPLVFGGNDTPGVMLASAARSYLNRYGVAFGKNTAIVTNNDSAYALALDLEAAGIAVSTIVDSRPEPGIAWTGKARLIAGAVISDAIGGKSLTGVSVWKDGRTERVGVDALAVSGGFSPIIHLACHRGAKPVWSDRHAAFLAPGGLEGLSPAGAANARTGIAASLEDGAATAASLIGDIGYNAKPAPFGSVEGDVIAAGAEPVWRIPGVKRKAFVDFQNDVHRDDLDLAVQEGYGHVELAKRYTTNGMATDQGKLSNVNAIGLLAEARGLSPADIGTTTFRPFYTPVSFGALAGTAHGRHFQPVRESPLHEWAVSQGARFVEAGLWYRSAWFPREGETTWRDSVDREVRNVRRNVGLCDVSTLGKIEVGGADAAVFLDRVYCNGFAKLPVGKARYGLMLREDGMIYDDGTVSRLQENRYFITTTTALAAGVLNHLEFCAKALWPELDVQMASVSDQWAQMAIAGPRSRSVLMAIVDQDLSNEAFPFLAARQVSLFDGRIRGRLFRISFSGELAYELAVPAGYATSVADAVLQAGEEHAIQPYGVEALSVLRIEKGHVTHNEINGTVVPDDLGLGRMVSATKQDFIGKHMLNREGLTSANRPQLVGVLPLDPNAGFRSGAHVLAKGGAARLENSEGYVTSSGYSPHVGSTIGLALISRGRERHGEEVLVWNALHDEFTPGRLTSPVFVDPANGRVHA